MACFADMKSAVALAQKEGCRWDVRSYYPRQYLDADYHLFVPPGQ